jgi:4-hydroxy-L-threonine phosphate dehydrogenase PdxA
MSNAQLPLMAIALGAPAGIGPEIVLKAAADPETFRLCRLLAVGPAAVAARQARALKLPAPVHVVAAVRDEGFRPAPPSLLDTDDRAPGNHRVHGVPSG